MSSKILLENGFNRIAGLDPSITLLRYAKSRLGYGFNPVQGVAENLPFRDGSFSGVLTCFSLRDVRDRASSLREFSRVIEEQGRMEIVDIGKPDNVFLRKLVGLYIAIAMPTIARFLIGGRLRGNPFRMINPTVQSLTTNHALAQLVGRIFGSSSLRAFLFGGLVIVEGRRGS